MQSGQEHEDWRDQVMRTLSRLERNQESMSDRLGKESEDGMGGSGLYGRVIRMEGDVKSLLTDRNFLRGAAALFIALSVFIVSNIKTWAASLFPHGGH